MEYVERKRWLLFALPFTFTKYIINEEQITVDTGLFNRKENDCYMYKVQDTVLETSLFGRMFGIGTIVCKTGDVTHPELIFKNIKHSKEIKDFIIKNSEDQRIRRRTINTLNISARPDMPDFNDMPEPPEMADDFS